MANEIIPTWTKIFIDLSRALIVFILAIFFALTSSDIKTYMEDHNLDIQYINFSVIVILTLIFYIIPKILIKLYLPEKHKQPYFYFLGMLASFIGLIMIHRYLFSLLASSNINYTDLGNLSYNSIISNSLPSNEIDALWRISFYWLFSILLINIFLSPILEMIVTWLLKQIGKLKDSSIRKDDFKDIDEASS